MFQRLAGSERGDDNSSINVIVQSKKGGLAGGPKANCFEIGGWDIKVNYRSIPVGIHRDSGK
jgi:hypothetical protein